MKKFKVTFIIEEYLIKNSIQGKAYKSVEVVAPSEEEAQTLAFKKVLGSGTRYYVIEIEELKDAEG